MEMETFDSKDINYTIKKILYVIQHYSKNTSTSKFFIDDGRKVRTNYTVKNNKFVGIKE